jgi:hypothetical protein
MIDGINLSHFGETSVLKSAGMLRRGLCLNSNDLRLAQKK